MSLSKAEKTMLDQDVSLVRYAQCTPRTIFCVVVDNKGQEIYGVSACRDLANFDEELGKLYALRHALGQLYRRKNHNID
mgnify:FL=1